MSKNFNKMMLYVYPSKEDKKRLLEDILKPTLFELLQGKKGYIIQVPLKTK